MTNILPFPNPDEVRGAQAPLNLDKAPDSEILDLWREACSMAYADYEVAINGNGFDPYAVKNTLSAVFPNLKPLTFEEVRAYLAETGRDSWLEEE